MGDEPSRLKQALPLALVGIGALVAAAGLTRSDGSGPRETLITLGLAAAAAGAVVALAAAARAKGRGRENALEKRFPGAVIFPAARTSEASVAFARLARKSHSSQRLPASFSVVVSESTLGLWSGGARSPQQLIEIAASRIGGVEFTEIRVNSLVRASVVVHVDEAPPINLPLSPIGSGAFGYGPLSAEAVRDLVARVGRTYAGKP